MAIEKRRLGRSGLDFTVLGLGGMRLPGLATDEAVKVVRYAIDSGINHIETSRHYGDSEVKIGEALKDGYRERVYLSTKNSKRDGPECRRELEESLERLQVEKLDFFQMWFVNDMDNFKQLMAPGGALAEAKKARDEGLLDHIGITGHSKNHEMIEYIETGEFESVTIYYNASDRGPSEVAARAKELDVGVVCMGPLKGGFLTGRNERFRSFLGRAPGETTAQGALRWLVSDPNVTTAIPGFASVAEVDEDMAIASRPPMSEHERRLVAAALSSFDYLKQGLCTWCKYCEGCPEEIDIPKVLDLLYTSELYGAHEHARRRYARLDKKAALCTACNRCVSKCPQKLPVPDLMVKVEELLGGGE